VVGEAGSVAAALAADVRLEPSAVLVEVELPDRDGVPLARELAALPWRPRVVLTSIDGDITSIDEARHAGVGARAGSHDRSGRMGPSVLERSLSQAQRKRPSDTGVYVTVRRR
jgi:DNA-binding NarL/FixJ family response regulator